MDVGFSCVGETNVEKLMNSRVQKLAFVLSGVEADFGFLVRFAKGRTVFTVWREVAKFFKDDFDFISFLLHGRLVRVSA